MNASFKLVVSFYTKQGGMKKGYCKTVTLQKV